MKHGLQLLLLFLPTTAIAQSWSDAGVPGGIPDVPAVVTVTDYGATGDGSDDSAAFQAAIEAAAAMAPGAVIVPPGSYTLNARIRMRSGVVLRGAGPDQTTLLIDHTRDSFFTSNAGGGTTWRTFTGYQAGSRVLTIPDPSGFVAGSFVQFHQDNDPEIMYTDPKWDNPGLQEAVGQIGLIVSVSGNQITLDQPIWLDYRADLNPMIRGKGMVDRVGIEDLRLVRLDQSGVTGIYFLDAANSWVSNVVSEFATLAHVYMNRSYRCEVRDSYFLDAGDHGGGGRGYGVFVGRHGTMNLVENNLFSRLRHAMIMSIGASGNVYGYNYSRVNIRNCCTEGLVDIALHGAYPHHNLFEANVVQAATSADYWGPSGPGNVLFRNRIEQQNTTTTSQPGILINDHSELQEVIGNEITDGTIVIDPTVNVALVHANRVQGVTTFDPGQPEDIGASLYLNSKPAFYGDMPWPSVGFDRPNGTIPAEVRYFDEFHNPDLEAWVNEFHYDDSGGDNSEFVEVAVRSGDPDDYAVVLYDGSTGERYSSLPLSSFQSGATNGGVRLYHRDFSDEIRDGGPHAIALCTDVNGDGFMDEPAFAEGRPQLISYGGPLIAEFGCASGFTSIDVGLAEEAGTPAGTSLSLEGGQPSDDWCISDPGTPGQVNNCSSGISFSIRLQLQGAYRDGGMSSEITESLPLQQPFGGESWGYFGPEEVPDGFFATNLDIVDWVLVGIRNSAAGPDVTRVAALLKADGTVVSTDGVSPVRADLPAGTYEVVVWHRNHLAIVGSGGG